MDDTVRIREGDFWAQVAIDKLPVLTLRNTRKLFHLMLTSGENQGSIEALREKLPAMVEAAKEHWKAASAYYAAGYHHVSNPKSRNESVRYQLRMNRGLSVAVRKAKAEYERWVKINSIFEGEMKV